MHRIESSSVLPPRERVQETKWKTSLYTTHLVGGSCSPCVYVHIHTYVRTHVIFLVWVSSMSAKGLRYVCVYIYILLYVCMYGCVYVHMYVWMCVYACMYVRMYVCLGPSWILLECLMGVLKRLECILGTSGEHLGASSERPSGTAKPAGDHTWTSGSAENRGKNNTIVMFLWSICRCDFHAKIETEWKFGTL